MSKSLEKSLSMLALIYTKALDEQLSPRGDFHTFQGKKDDQWMLIQDEEKSVPFLELGRTQFTPDSYGIQTIARDSNGKSLSKNSTLKSLHTPTAFDSLGATQYYHLP